MVAERVAAARERMAGRLAGTPWRVNAEVPGHVLRRRWRLPWEVVAEAERLLDRGALTARGVDRVLRVAWTLADLAGRDVPDAGDVRLALDCRGRRAVGGVIDRRGPDAGADPGPRADPAGRAGRRRGWAARWPVSVPPRCSAGVRSGPGRRAPSGSRHYRVRLPALGRGRRTWPRGPAPGVVVAR